VRRLHRCSVEHLELAVILETHLQRLAYLRVPFTVGRFDIPARATIPPLNSAAGSPGRPNPPLRRMTRRGAASARQSPPPMPRGALAATASSLREKDLVVVDVLQFRIRHVIADYSATALDG
jgi:hypothetical protein